MRVSKFFQLEQNQPSLDFVDVDVYRDLPIFVDPRAIRLLQSPWGDECVHLIQDFFQTVMSAIQNGNDIKARKLLRTLREPNETHLGLSRGRSRGRALGRSSARDVWQSLKNSEAAKSGLLEDLEDTILMVEGIAADIVSDITTNIIRGPLIEYTHQACRQYGIPMTPDVSSGPLWNPQKKEWYERYVKLPVV